jgi:NAD(P)H-hydrate repair Nnr-like enzyme with NAD(P)H-hydrate dehydratase domain
LLSKGASRLDAARAASHIAKAAGEAAATVRGYGATARDVADAVPLVVTRIEAAQQAKA